MGKSNNGGSSHKRYRIPIYLALETIWASFVRWSMPTTTLASSTHPQNENWQHRCSSSWIEEIGWNDVWITWLLEGINLAGRSTILGWLSFLRVLNKMFGTSASVLSKRLYINVSQICLLEGHYQIQQAKGYIKEHLKPSPLDEDQLEFIVELCAHHSGLVRTRFASRHSSSKNYIATVEFEEDSDEDPMTGWFCTCACGSRVFSCCAHTTALIWQLGVCRGEVETISNPLSSRRFFEFIRDSADLYLSEDDDDNQSTEDGENTTMDAWRPLVCHLFSSIFPMQLIGVVARHLSWLN